MEQIPAGQIRFSTEKLQKRIRELGQEIGQDYAGQELILISVLKGSLYFFADLTRAIDLPIQLDFISIGTYPTTTNQKGIVRITKDLDLEITGKHVLLVEDIIRTGLTTAYLVQALQARMPASIKVCTLLSNPDEQLINVPIAYCGFVITATRLIGYGMDVREQGRNLPYIAELPKST
ncbi:MAG: hypoxanthine phosphoribosyltransferase [Eubacteriales bacterium]|nr:hypoxanthine phosphoribosyltransferase [Clostridiales bacterium]MDD4139298.1 hypoxanthine phosphoribosyltransferase [Eubacteriales bacterium]MDD4744486.1 hypoxanthine phosphoribosyltransferase [Eubacteriales bacterium]